MMEKFSFVKINRVSALPQGPGVYCFADAKSRYLYIGKAVNIKQRIKSHLQNRGFKENQWLKVAKKIGFIETAGEIEALLLEAKLIKELKPAFNVMWRDDKNFFYVMITTEKLPRVYPTHQPLKLSGDSSPTERKSIWRTVPVGPFVDGRAIKITLRYLRHIFPYYTQKDHLAAPCQWCQLELCPGPNPNPQEYKKNIKKLLQVLQGKKSTVLKTLEKEMRQAAQNNDFEKAAALRDKIFALQRVLKNAAVFFRTEKEEKLHPWPKIQKQLAYVYSHDRKNMRKHRDIHHFHSITRVEAYDISNIQGKMATGSMVVFVNGKPFRQEYRRFKIKTKETPDDFAMMKETIARRLKHPEWGQPDLILLDGGKAQLGAAKKALKSLIPKYQSPIPKLMAIAKRQNTLYLPHKKEPLKLAGLPRELAHFILHARDEAHRFALTYHKKLREKVYVSEKI